MCNEEYLFPPKLIRRIKNINSFRHYFYTSLYLIYFLAFLLKTNQDLGESKMFKYSIPNIFRQLPTTIFYEFKFGG